MNNNNGGTQTPTTDQPTTPAEPMGTPEPTTPEPTPAEPEAPAAPMGEPEAPATETPAA